MGEPTRDYTAGATGADHKPKAPDPPPLFRLRDIITEVVDEATAAHEARKNQQPRGPVTSFPILDRELGGALSQGVTILHGGPGAGKSALVLQWAASCKCPALLVTCEMSAPELFRRHMARISGDYLNRFKNGSMLPADVRRKAEEAAAAAPNLCILDATRAPANPVHLRNVTEAVRGDARHVLLVVDSLHAWSEGLATQVQGSDEYDVLNQAVAALRMLSHQLACPILAVAERNRQSMTKGGLSGGAGTRKIEYGAECVLEIDRAADAREDGAGAVPVKLTLSKNRNGSPGKTIALNFSGKTQNFWEVDKCQPD
jgi:replicative DNA helicase